MINDFTYNGKSLSFFGFVIKERPKYKTPERNFEMSDESLGNGSEIINYGGFKNVEFPYSVNSIPFLNRHMMEHQRVRALNDWLYADTEYHELRDTYNPDYFTQGIFINPAEINSLFDGALETTLTVSRRPYWYSDLGQIKIEKDNDTESITLKINNPEQYDSEPYIKITTNGSFTLTVNNIHPLVFSECRDYVEIDTEIYHVFKGAVNKSTTYTGNYLPVLKKGENIISIVSTSSNNITKVEVIPRWRRI